MKVIHKLILCVGLALLVTGCGRDDSFDIAPGSDVRIQKQDGVEVRGTLVEVGPDEIVVDARGARTRVARSEIRTIAAAPPAPPAPQAEPGGRDEGRQGVVRTTGADSEDSHSGGASEPRGPLARLFNTGPEYRAVTIPADTMLPAALQSAVASDASAGEDAIRATLRRPIVIDGIEALPAGTVLHGNVIKADRSGRVKGRAMVAFRFNRIDTPEDGRMTITSATITRVAPATKKKDAATIGVGAAGGAIVGGLLGGGEGAAKGAAVGGAAGTGVVLSTRGEEIRLATGTPLSVRLTRPVTVRVAVER